MDAGSPAMWRPRAPATPSPRPATTVKARVMWRPRVPASTFGTVAGTAAPEMWRPRLPGPTTTPPPKPTVRVTLADEDSEFGVVVGSSTGGALLVVVGVLLFVLISK